MVWCQGVWGGGSASEAGKDGQLFLINSSMQLVSLLTQHPPQPPTSARELGGPDHLISTKKKNTHGENIAAGPADLAQHRRVL